MIINPKEILEKKIVKGIEEFPEIDVDNQLQQNGIDLRIAEASLIYGKTIFTVDKKSIEKPEYSEVQIYNNTMTFVAGNAYSIDFMEWVKVPEGMCGHIVQRSTVNRFGGTVVSGLWDSGFDGRLGAIFRPTVDCEIEVGFKMAQIMFFRADNNSMYDGQYQGQRNIKDQVGR